MNNLNNALTATASILNGRAEFDGRNWDIAENYAFDFSDGSVYWDSTRSRLVGAPHERYRETSMVYETAEMLTAESVRAIFPELVAMLEDKSDPADSFALQLVPVDDDSTGEITGYVWVMAVWSFN